MALLCNARKSKNAVRLGGVSELLAQFSGAVRGLSTERHCAMPAMQTPRKLSHAWRSERTVGFAFCGGTPSRRRTRIIFQAVGYCIHLWCILNFVLGKLALAASHY